MVRAASLPKGNHLTEPRILSELPASPTYDQLWEQGATLRLRVVELTETLEPSIFLREVRAWQLRCTALVSRRDAHWSGDFRMLCGPMQRLTVDTTGRLGWANRCHESIASWQTMIDWMRLLARNDGHAAIAGRLERPKQRRSH